MNYYDRLAAKISRVILCLLSMFDVIGQDAQAKAFKRAFCSIFDALREIAHLGRWMRQQLVRSHIVIAQCQDLEPSGPLEVPIQET